MIPKQFKAGGTKEYQWLAVKETISQVSNFFSDLFSPWFLFLRVIVQFFNSPSQSDGIL